MEKYTEMNYFKRMGFGLLGIFTGITDTLNTHVNATIHGNYHEFDRNRLSIAKGAAKSGLGYLISNRNFVTSGIKQMRRAHRLNFSYRKDLILEVKNDKTKSM